jgi:inosine-uridine nucleoside N-ribohydrolase
MRNRDIMTITWSTAAARFFRVALWAVVALTTGAAAASEPIREPVRLVFDTDIGNDVDDAMALSLIHALASRGECQLLAVTITKHNQYAAPMVDLLNTFYGRPQTPIGVVRDGVTPQDGKYLRQLVTAEDDGRPRYPRALRRSDEAPEAVGLLRKVLAAQPDGSVVLVQVGFSTNLARLLDSRADDNCALTGRELVRQKVRLLSAMAGAFGEKKGRREYNIVTDLPAARKLFTHWPTPIVASGWEIGNAIKHSSRSMREDYRYAKRHPLVEAYRHYRGLENDQPTYDLTSVLYGVRPERGYFELSPPGRITIEQDGTTSFHAEPHGPHRYLIVSAEQIVRVREAQEMLCSQPPVK